MRTSSTPPLHQAIDEYLEWASVHAFKPGSGSPRTYRTKLGMYAREFGPNTPVGTLTGQDWYRTCNHLWLNRAAETYNSGRRAALSFLAFCRDTEPAYTEAVPPKLWRQRPVPKDRSKALPQKDVFALLNDPQTPLRERVLWWMLYDTSERLDAVLALDIPDLNMAGCHARLRIKGADTRFIVWSPSTCRLLQEYVGERTWGPLFLGENLAWNWRDRPMTDLGPGGRYRLTPHRAATVYVELTGNRRLHRLRHSRLTHLANAGVNSPTLKAISGHLSDRMLSHYAQPGPEEVAAVMAEIEQQMAALHGGGA